MKKHNRLDKTFGGKAFTGQLLFFCFLYLLIIQELNELGIKIKDIPWDAIPNIPMIVYLCIFI